MHHYMEFMEECERLKDLFLLEGEDDKKNAGDPDDLAEMESGDGTSEESSGVSGEESSGDPTDATAEEPADPMAADTDLDLNSDLGDLTGDTTLEPEADEVNAEEKPGAINPATLYQELTQGDDNIYDRTAKAVLEKFPGGKCEVRDMLPIIAIGIKSYMRNKNYAPLPKADMKKLVFRIAHDIHDRLSGKKREPATEAVFYTKETPALTEGWKELALAGALAAAPAASHAATAESAPYNTHQGTSKIITNNRSMDVDSREMVHTRDNYGGSVNNAVKPGTKASKDAKSGRQVGRTSIPAREGGASSEVPVVSDYSMVTFDEGTTYQVTPEQLRKMRADGNVPARYQILDKDANVKPTAKAAAATGKSGKSASVTQAAAKKQAGKNAKAGTKAATGRCPVDAERCGCGGADEDINWKETIHKGAHDATDLALAAGGTVVDAAKKVPSTLGKVAGFLKRSFLNNSAELEKDHDRMIAEREK